ncbi:MAG: hypothetical protein WA885_20815 [Phormidesmis sp.]
MKPSYLLTAEPTTEVSQPDSSALNPTGQTALQLDPGGRPQKAQIRHILLGSPDAVRQTIHLLHILRYAETILWTPVLTIAEPVILTPA